ncbi:MAG: homoserine dehydrogenase [Chloroflexi bacterium]|nr:homoserine dehydrogenase [Chloroflexota bacterium]
MEKRSYIGIGLLGLGVVGSGVAKVLWKRADMFAEQLGLPLSLRKVLVRHPAKHRELEVEPRLLTTRFDDVLADPTVDIVIEVMGGESPAKDYIQQSLVRGKHVVTANKEVIAKHGPGLLALAREHCRELRYEASVGGGIPLIAPFQQDLAANRISAIHAIINGTTNYILTRMANEGMDFSAALRQAQELGYAEANPANDIEGTDAAYKLAILATLAFRSQVRPQDVFQEGISRLGARDFRYARELGYTIKLLAISKEKNGAVEARVHPVFIPSDSLLAQVGGVYNAVQVEGDLVGKVIFYGRGAGAEPTSSAIMADVLAISRNICCAGLAPAWLRSDRNKAIIPVADIETRFYLRMNVADSPGVLAQIARILGENQISISSVIQKENDRQAQTAEIVIMTHPARESAMQKALKEAAALEVVREIANFIRVEG